jgi:dolichyl-phosphate-mannose--protein O-mannosyl transferase
MNEEVAKTKWCPMARQALVYTTDYYGMNHSSSPSGNKFHTGKIPTGCLCITSDCMMWRWSEEEREITYDKPIPCREEDGWSKNNIRPDIVEYSRMKPNRQGYCGLGGKS